MQIVPERHGDAQAISDLTTSAFATAEHSDGNEAHVVETLRSAGALTLSLVAIDDSGQVIGHIAFSPVRIEHGHGHWFGLGPVSVLPERQRKGIGKALIEKGLSVLSDRGAEGCILVGEPAYYRRFGFTSDDRLTYHGHPSPYLQRLNFKGEPPTGEVTYHSAFQVA